MVLSMERWTGQVAVVTGASSGIGAAIATQLVQHGIQVVGLARRKEKIEELAQKLSNYKGKLYALKTDMTKEDDILESFAWIKKNLGPIHILINNAGLTQKGLLSDGETQAWKAVLDVNVLGLCIATREAVKSMRENNIDGHIVHINSIAGHKVHYFPELNIYHASKHAVTALTETLRLEFNSLGLKIKITSVSPGATESEFLTAGGFDFENSEAAKSFALVLKAEDIADAVSYALSTPPHVQVHELTIKPVNEPY